MLNQRGSALLNVMAAVAMLLILGFGLMQAINSDSVLAVRNSDVTHAIQMAEGGIDYGLELLIAGSEEILGELNWPGIGDGELFLIEVDEGDVEVTIEEIVPEKEFVITSRSYRKNAIRQIKVYVTHYGDINAPFSHSLFIGGEDSDPDDEVTLQNLTIHGSVYIAAKNVKLINVTFNGDVHFASEQVTFQGNCSLNIQAKATAEAYTDVLGVNTNHWASNMERVSDLQQIPDVAISDFQSMAGFEDWGVSSVPFHHLKRLNYFDQDVTIVFNDNHGFPSEAKMVVAGSGSVTFEAQGNYQVDMNRTLIVMAEGDIIDVGKISNKANNKPKVDLYLYSKGSIQTDQNIYPSSIMAQMIGTHSQNYVINAPDPAVFDDLPDEIRNTWGASGYRITKWEN